MRLPECSGDRSFRKRSKRYCGAKQKTVSGRFREIVFWPPTNTSLPSVCTTSTRWAAIRISRRALSLGTWPTISMNRGGKRMVMWSSGSSSRRTCIPASTAPAVLSTPMSSPARRTTIPPGHNQIMRSAQNQE